MLKVEFESRFKKDYKRCLKRGLKNDDFKTVLEYLVREEELPSKYRDHILINTKEFHNVRECHINPDWLLIYRVEKEILTLKLIRTGSHSDLF